jgi:hypothetical protein
MGFFGGSPPDTIPDWEFQTGSYLSGQSIIIPDVNGDGYDDIAVCTENNCDAYLFYGGLSVSTTWNVFLAEWKAEEPPPAAFI